VLTDLGGSVVRTGDWCSLLLVDFLAKIVFLMLLSRMK
jgi:hypothetical protein